jgi:hypothetical protein
MPRPFVKTPLMVCVEPQRVCMKGYSQFGPLAGNKGHGHGQVIFAHGGLEIGK